MIRVGVVGAAGRMGRSVIDAVSAADDLVLTAAVDPRIGEIGLGESVAVATSLDLLEDGAADVLVDFTVPDAARVHLAAALRRGFHLVVGTTGLTDKDIAELREVSTSSGAHAVIAANFAIGAVLLMRFAALAAPYFDSVEIVELHHDQKLDAPSGTAIATARGIAAARSDAGMGEPHDPTTVIVLPGARGGSGPGGVRIHSVRLPGLVAHEEVLFGGLGQGLTIRHDSYDRSSFMSGVLLAVRSVEGRSGVTIGLDALLAS